MPVSSNVLILVAVDKSASLDLILDLLSDEKLPCPPAPFTSIRVERISLLNVEKRIRRRHRASTDSAIVLISDGLVDEQDYQLPDTSATRDLLDAFGDSLLTMIAVMCHPARISNIERSISSRPDAMELGNALERCLRKLAYLRKPAEVREMDPARYRFRVLRYEHEFLKYFRFRYDVYSVMCYLDAEAEQAPSRLEVDWFDKSSVHLGVYYHANGFEQLVGTGRLITTQPIAGTARDMVSRVTQLDPVLRASLENAVGLQLPVLQSHRFTDLVCRMLDSGVIVGEISRIIVAPEHRGMGLSREITRRLIDLAKEAGLSDLLLECLPIHAPIYCGCGYQLVPHTAGKVYKIGRSMDVMVLPLGERSVFSPRALAKVAEEEQSK